MINGSHDTPPMLDHCSISHKGGIIFWSRSFTPSSSPLNSLVRDALIQGRTTDEHYEKDGYAVKWSVVNDLELIFVVSFDNTPIFSILTEI